MVANAWLEGTYSERYPHIRRTRRAWPGSSGSSPSPGASPATPRPRRRARSTRAVSSATRWPTPTAPPSTIPTWWWPAWSATARPRPAPPPPAGTPTSSSTRARDGVVLPILHLNGYKIANPTVLARIPTSELLALFTGYGYRPLRGGGRLRRGGPACRCTPAWRGPRRRLRRDRRHPGRGPRRAFPGPPGLAHDHPAHPQGLDGPQGRRRPADGGHVPGPPAAPDRGPHQPRHIWPSWRSGCAATGPRSSSTPRASRSRRSSVAPSGRRRRMSANPHANGGLLLRTSSCPTSGLRRAGGRPGSHAARGHPDPRRLPARRHRRPTRRPSASSAPTRRPRTACRTSSR